MRRYISILVLACATTFALAATANASVQAPYEYCPVGSAAGPLAGPVIAKAPDTGGSYCPRVAGPRVLSSVQWPY